MLCHFTRHTHHVWHERGHSHLPNTQHKLHMLPFFLFCFFTHHILFASHSHFPFSHAWSCSCVSRAMFPETERQAVSQMMATESNYRPAVLECMVMRVWLSFLSRSDLLTLYKFTSDPWHPFFFIATE